MHIFTKWCKISTGFKVKCLSSADLFFSYARRQADTNVITQNNRNVNF